MTTHPEPIVRTIATSTHGRYVVERPAHEGPYPLVIGFHGYGENAERHLDRLRHIPGASDWLIASVQALHRFYDSKTGEVIGCWMTRLDREQAIVDNVRYVGDVVAQLTHDYPLSDRLTYVGFSQGAAMAYRAATRVGHRCHGLIVLAGDVPPELKSDDSIQWPPILLGCGRRDEWYTQDTLNTDLAFLHSKRIEVETVVFEGGHAWGNEFCEAAGRFLRDLGF